MDSDSPTAPGGASADEAQNAPDWLGRDPPRPAVAIADTATRSKSILHVLLVLVGALVVPSLLLVLGLAALGLTESGAPVAYYGAQTALNMLGLGVVGVGYLYWAGETRMATVRWPTRRDGAAILVGGVLFVAVMLGFEALLDLLDVEIAENVAVERGRENPELFLLFVPLQFLLVAPAEEVLFRGAIQGLVRRAYGVVPGVLGAGLIFALFHAPALAGTTGQLPTLGIILVTGCLLGAVYEYSGNLAVPILIHGVWNAIVFSTQYANAVEMVQIG